MSTVRINDKIKEEVTPILSDLGISLSEAINMFLHQIKLYKGIPFEVRIKQPIELKDGNGSYICEYGHIHDYSKIDFEKLEKEAKQSKKYKNSKGGIKDILKEE